MKQHLMRHAVTAALLCLSGTAVMAADNLLVNGDFEGSVLNIGSSGSGAYRTSYPAGWTDLAGGNYRYGYTVFSSNERLQTANPTDLRTAPTAASGSHLLRVGAWSMAGDYSSGSGLVQDITVTAGTAMTFRYAYQGDHVSAALIDLGVANYARLTAVSSSSTTDANGWTTVTGTFIPTSSLVRVKLDDGVASGFGSFAGGYIDNVSLTVASAVPEAGTLPMLTMGLATLLGMRAASRRQRQH